MKPEEVDQLAELCSDAALTETGKRLYAALVSDALFTRILGDHPDPAAVADELGPEKIAQIACQEFEALTDDDREQLADDAADHLRKLVVSVAKPAFKAMRNGILESDQLTPDFLIAAAAAACVAKGTK